MTLFQGPGFNPRTAACYTDLLRAYGAIGDSALRERAGFCERKAAIAVSLADVAGFDAGQRNVLYFAGILHAIGALGNPGLRPTSGLSLREAAVARWDVPADGARACATLHALPNETANVVRWQFESWDGTGFPDQLRWHTIPREAQLLRLADAVVRAGDPDDALTQVADTRGRDIGPQTARVFTAWFQQTSDEVHLATAPDLPDVSPDDCTALLEHVADCVDEHMQMPHRWRRVAAIADFGAGALQIAPQRQELLAVAARTFSAGEVGAATEDAVQLDPLSRLGIDQRALAAREAARIFAELPSFAGVHPILSARSEWFDGTGKPSGTARDGIPLEARILAAAIAREALERTRHTQLREHVSAAQRLEGAAGTQFDPVVVRAIVAAPESAYA